MTGRIGTERGESGAIALLVAMAAALVFVGATVGVIVAADVHGAAARARIGADAAALAGMAASPLAGGDGDPDTAARRLAEANAAHVVDIDRRGWPLRFAVTVRADTQLDALTRLLPEGVRADAAAAVRPLGIPVDVEWPAAANGRDARRARFSR